MLARRALLAVRGAAWRADAGRARSAVRVPLRGFSAPSTRQEPPSRQAAKMATTSTTKISVAPEEVGKKSKQASVSQDSKSALLQDSDVQGARTARPYHQRVWHRVVGWCSSG